MTKDEIEQAIEGYLQDADNAIGEEEEYIRGWKTAMLVALELIDMLDDK